MGSHAAMVIEQPEDLCRGCVDLYLRLEVGLEQSMTVHASFPACLQPQGKFVRQIKTASSGNSLRARLPAGKCSVSCLAAA